MQSNGVSKACARRLPGAFRRGRDGNIAALTALLLAVLLGSMALSFDLGRAYDLQTEMQSAADAAAIAAGTQLDNSANAINRACLAAVGTTTNCNSNTPRHFRLTIWVRMSFPLPSSSTRH
jgi:Flp pilus assembly protein TadG